MTTAVLTPAPLAMSTPESLGLDPERLSVLDSLIERHISEGRYPGAQYAVARYGKLAKVATFGDSLTDPDSIPANEETLWLMFSQTKVVVTAALWQLVEAGELRFADRISDHIPEFEANGKGDITLFQVITHQGGFPNAEVPEEAWEDHDLLRASVSDFTLEWTPGSRVHYHGTAAHWVAAALIEAVTGSDFRDYVRGNLLRPIGLDNEIFVGVSEAADHRCADIHTSKRTKAFPTAAELSDLLATLARGAQPVCPARADMERRAASLPSTRCCSTAESSMGQEFSVRGRFSLAPAITPGTGLITAWECPCTGGSALT